jgi:hypothetical protein
MREMLARSDPIGGRSETPSVIGHGGVSAPGGNRDAIDGQEGGKISTRRDGIARGRGRVPAQKERKTIAEDARENWRTWEVPEQSGQEGNKSVDNTRHRTGRKRAGKVNDSENNSTAPRKKRDEAEGPPGRKTPHCSADPDASGGRRRIKRKRKPRSLSPPLRP